MQAAVTSSASSRAPACVRHLPVPEELQVPQRDQLLQVVRDASARGEARTSFRRQVVP